MVALLILGVLAVIRGIQLRNSRAAGSVHLSFSPSSINLVSPQNVNIVANTGAAKVGFIRVDISFNKNVMRLNADPVITSPVNKPISMTSVANANSSGKLSMVLGLDPDSIASAPSGEFAVATLAFTPVTPLSTQPATVVIDVENSQVVDLDPSELLLSAGDLSVTFDVATPTPTVAPTGSATAIPTAAATASPTASAVATASPTSSPNVNACAQYGDIDSNNKVDAFDYVLFVNNYRTDPPFANPLADINADGQVTLLDYIVLFENFGRQCQ